MNAIGKIGVVMPIIRDELDSEFLHGIQNRAAQLGYDVIVFTNSSNAQMEFLHNEYVEGEFNIYRLLSMVKLDGVILGAGKFTHSDVIERIIEILASCAVPCLVTEKKQEQFPYIFSSQEEAFYLITRHMIEEHYAKKCYCLTGPAGNYQAEERLSGFQRAIAEAGLTDENVRVFYGDFWKNSAAVLGTQIAKGEIPMPDAVVCASDMMAITLCDTLQEYGISVPGDVKITGFDGNIRALTHFPSITTASNIECQLAESAVNRLYEMMTHKKIHTASAQYQLKLRLGESCGCSHKHNEQVRINQMLRKNRAYHDTVHELYVTSNYITRLSEAESIDELIGTVNSIAHLLRSWVTLDLCLCSDWIMEKNNPKKYRTEGYSSQMLLAVSKRFGYADEKTGYRFDICNILPSLSKPHEPRYVVLTPVHNLLQVFGYLASSYQSALDYQCDYYYNNWCDALANGLRSLQQKLYTEQIERQIAEYSIKDRLSGMHNRKGFLEQAHIAYGKFTAEGKYGILLLIYVENSQGIRSDAPEEIMPVINAIQLFFTVDTLSARISTNVFSVLLPYDGTDDAQETAEKQIVHFEKTLKTIYSHIKKSVLPKLVFDHCRAEISDSDEAEKILHERMQILMQKVNLSATEENDYTCQLVQIRREIKLEPQLDWNVDRIAARIGISTSYLHRLYSHQFGRTCKEEILAARLSKAKKLLRDTNLHIVEIAEKCGYDDPTSFMRLFKSKVGMTAKQYRLSAQKKKN